jgi:hypothetical protein
MAETPITRPFSLQWPLDERQVEDLNAVLDDVYELLRQRKAAAPTQHNVLSDTHDAEVATAANGDILVRAGGVWTRLAIGANGTHLQVIATTPAWSTDGSTLTAINADNITSGTLAAARLADSGVAAGTYGDSTHVSQVTVDVKGRVTAASNVALSLPATTHNLLSTTHPDTTPASPSLGDLVVAQSGAASTSDVGRFWIDGAPFEAVPNGNDVGAEAFWQDGQAAAGIATTGAVTWQRKPNGTNGYVLTATPTGIDWQPAAGGSTLGAGIYRASDFVLADRTPTAVALSTLVFDDGTFWTIALPSRLTIPVGAGGAYAITGAATWDSATLGLVYAHIYVNGVRRATGPAGTANAPVGYYDPALVSTVLKLNAGDYVELYVEHAANVAGTSYTVKGGTEKTFLQLGRLNSESVVATGLPSPVAGNLIQGNAGATAYDRLAIGAADTVLLSSGAAAGWSTRVPKRDVAEAISSIWSFAGGIQEFGRTAVLGDPTAFTPTLTCDVGTWTVGGGTMACKAARIGPTLWVVLLSIENTTLSSTPAQINITLPFTSVGNSNVIIAIANGGAWKEGFISFQTSSNIAIIQLLSGATFTTGLGTYIRSTVMAQST